MDYDSWSSEFYGNSTYNGTNEPYAIGWIGKFSGAFLLLVSLVGILGNITVIYVVLRYSKMKTVTNTYILNLSFADTLLMFALIFLSISTLCGFKWVFGAVMCHIVYAIDGLNMFCSVFVLTSMSVDRYIAICHARAARRYRNIRVSIAINAGVWLLSLAAASPIILVTRHDRRDQACGSNFAAVFGKKNERLTQKLFIVYYFILGFVVPLVVIVICYSSIAIRLRKVGSKIGKMKKSRRVNRLVLYVVMGFVVCWTPFYVVRVVSAFYPAFSHWIGGSIIVSDLTMCLSYINSCINPVLYSCLSGNFRKSFKKAWNCESGEKYQHEGINAATGTNTQTQNTTKRPSTHKLPS